MDVVTLTVTESSYVAGPRCITTSESKNPSSVSQVGQVLLTVAKLVAGCW